MAHEAFKLQFITFWVILLTNTSLLDVKCRRISVVIQSRWFILALIFDCLHILLSHTSLCRNLGLVPELSWTSLAHGFGCGWMVCTVTVCVMCGCWTAFCRLGSITHTTSAAREQQEIIVLALDVFIDPSPLASLQTLLQHKTLT